MNSAYSECQFDLVKNRSQFGCGRFGSYQKSTENLLNTQQI